MTDQSPRLRFEMNLETRTLFDMLKKAEIGETVSYDTLSQALGQTVTGGHPALQAALRRLITEGVLFANVRKQGYKRLADTEVVQYADHQREHLRRTATRAGRRLGCIQDFTALSKEEQIKHNALMTVFSATRAMTKTKQLSKIEGAVENAGAALPIAKTLELFR